MFRRTRAAVLADAAQRFPHENIDTIMAILDEYPRYKGAGSETDTEAGIARVHLAILKLSEGDITWLRQGVELANRDFRDVLMLEEIFLRGGQDQKIIQATSRRSVMDIDFAAYNKVLATKPFSFPLREEELDRMIITVGAGSEQAKEVEVTNIIILAPDAILLLASLDHTIVGKDSRGYTYTGVDKGIVLEVLLQEPLFVAGDKYPYGLAAILTSEVISLQLKYQGTAVGRQSQDGLPPYRSRWLFDRPPHRSGYTLEFS